MAVVLKFHQAELAKLEDAPGLLRFIGDLGNEVAQRANARAAKLFTDQGGGGVGSIESHVEHDAKGPFARIGYPAEYWYMVLHEVGTEHERPRPHLRPALFGTRKATGGKESAIKSIRQDKKTALRTKRNRSLFQARRAG